MDPLVKVDGVLPGYDILQRGSGLGLRGGERSVSISPLMRFPFCVSPSVSFQLPLPVALFAQFEMLCAQCEMSPLKSVTPG